MTMRHLVEHTGLARRTLYAIVKRLRDAGLLKEQISLQDARQTWFWLPQGYVGSGAPGSSAKRSS